MQAGKQKEYRERLTYGPLGFFCKKERGTDKRECERRSENEREVEKEEVRSVYGRLRVDEIRHFGASVKGEPCFHGSCTVTKKERSGIRKRTLRGVDHDREARSRRHPLILEMLRKREKRNNDG